MGEGLVFNELHITPQPFWLCYTYGSSLPLWDFFLFSTCVNSNDDTTGEVAYLDGSEGAVLDEGVVPRLSPLRRHPVPSGEATHPTLAFAIFILS